MNYLEIAKKVAIQAGSLINSIDGTSIEKKNKGTNFDIITDLDTRIENNIKEELNKLTPHIEFLGEEESFKNKYIFKERLNLLKKDALTWIVDPIDGTSNYSQGIPFFSVSIALISYGEIILGVIYDPVRNELYHAEKDQGAYLNDKPIYVQNTMQLNNSVIGTGFTAKPLARKRNLNIHEKLSGHCQSIRAFGSAALHLAYVASGRLTAFIQNGLYLWDVAAGVLIIKEAGGTITNMKGDELSLEVEDVVCSNTFIHDRLLQSLQ